MPRFARRITQTSPKSFGMFQKAAALGSSGKDLIHLELGRPFHDTPAHIKDATVKALRDGLVHYSDMRGEPALRRALQIKLAEHNKISVSVDEILMTNGLTQASFVAFMALLDEGDEAILLEPYYPQHINKIEMTGAKVVLAPLDRQDNFSIKRELIEPLITARTRMIVLVNPSNPTGRVYTRGELEILADLAIRHDLTIVSDEVYDQILFDGAEHVSIASLPGMKERTISMFAFTKAYAMDGWRLGYIAADAAMMPALLKLTANEITHVNTFIQYGALAAVAGDPAILEEMVADDRRKRELVVSRLNQMPGVICPSPEGTIYAFPNISGTGLKSQQAADLILEKAGVVVEAGGFYGEAGDDHLRVCFGSESYERLEQAMDRLSTFFNSL
ncbi:pyridoxal phosphate-dependent aminotransferase [Rhizobium sp. RAF56]|uniref:pyridoxal phosphate-dependent aminotransferase n=1 Tax=Rhizobium sp. RAF56 TaxID=3233062 RepID=UPI003F96F4B4